MVRLVQYNQFDLLHQIVLLNPEDLYLQILLFLRQVQLVLEALEPKIYNLQIEKYDQ
jgi:hypothetical protein